MRRLVSPVAQSEFSSAPPGHSRVTVSRHLAVINGDQWTCRRRDLYSAGAYRTPGAMAGHTPATVRDGEALAAIPGPWRCLTEWPVRELDSYVAGFAPVLMPRPEDLL
jgi:hypothetical protein